MKCSRAHSWEENMQSLTVLTGWPHTCQHTHAHRRRSPQPLCSEWASRLAEVCSDTGTAGGFSTEHWESTETRTVTCCDSYRCLSSAFNTSFNVITGCTTFLGIIACVWLYIWPVYWFWLVSSRSREMTHTTETVETGNCIFPDIFVDLPNDLKNSFPCSAYFSWFITNFFHLHFSRHLSKAPRALFVQTKNKKTYKWPPVFCAS